MLDKDELNQIVNALKEEAKSQKPNGSSVKEILFFGSIILSIILYLALALLIIR